MDKGVASHLFKTRTMRDWVIALGILITVILGVLLFTHHHFKEEKAEIKDKIEQEDRMYDIVSKRLGMDSKSIMISNKGSDDSVSGQRVRYEINANGVLYTAEFNKDFSKITRLVENEKSGKQKE